MFIVWLQDKIDLGVSKMIDIAVIPVAGQGTRLLPATKSQPKEMLPVGRKPVVQYVVEELTRVGIHRMLFITGAGKHSIENHFDLNPDLIENLRENGKEELLAELEFERTSTQYFYTRQRKLLGLGHAILCAQPFIGDQPFVVALGDSIIGLHAQSKVVKRMIDIYQEQNATAVIAFEQVPYDEVHQYGIARAKDPGNVFEVLDLIEKPSVDEAPSNLAIAARYVLSPAIFDAIRNTKPGKSGEIQLTDAISILLQNGGKIYGVCLQDNEKRYDIGNFESYFNAFIEFALADEKYGDTLRQSIEELLYAHHP
jgi:UTP--glucose-1-phosphate uridylyltransferase